MMDYIRAEEIIQSEDTIEVFYQNQSVWIQNLNPRNETAQVLNSEEEMIEVHVRELEEGNVIS